MWSNLRILKVPEHRNGDSFDMTHTIHRGKVRTTFKNDDVIVNDS